MSSEAKTHPWHMVEPSPWPMVGSIGAFLAAVGGIWYMHEGPIWGFAAGMAIILFCMFGWWRDVVKEAESGSDHTSVVQTGLRMGMILFIASEVMFFFAFFWAYFNASVPFLSFVASPAWPPEGIAPLPTWELPFLNTMILLTSGATLTVAHHAIRAGDRQKLVRWLIMTVALGFLFLGTQIYEYGHATFKISDGIYPSTFYLATGFHGFHVFVGACFLLVCTIRASKGHFTEETHIGFEAAAWYWHFVDVVWLFLFIWVYWWGSAGYNFG
jgi:cytochrome c oxidase subunit 3